MKKKGGSTGTTIRHFLMDLLVHLEGEDDKLFNGKIISPIDTLQLAILEVECWRKASRKEKMNEDHNGYATLLGETVPLWTS